MYSVRVLSFLLCLTLAMTAVGCTQGETGSLSSLAVSSVSSGSSSEAEEISSGPALGPYDHRVLRVLGSEAYWRLTGRSMTVVDDFGQNAVGYDHAAQGFFFNADCEGAVTLHLSLNADMHFLVRVDGESRDVRVNRLVQDPVIRLAEDLPRGRHSFELYRCNELQTSVASLDAIELDGTLLPYEAPDRDLKMIFLGDSITAGEGITSVKGEKRTFMHSDATKTYAFLTGEALNADFYLLAQSGMTTTSCYNYYDKISWKRSTQATFDNAGEEVDVFVISLGTNRGKLTDEELAAQIKALIARVRGDHPSAKIVWCYGQLVNGSGGVIRAAVEELAVTDANLYYYQFKVPNNASGNSHPTAEANARDAQELTDFLRGTVLK